MALTPVARNRLLAVVALLVAGGGLALVATGIGDNLVYYWSPKELIEQGEAANGPTIRLGGLVRQGTVNWNEQHTELTFVVAHSPAPEAPAVRVRTREIPPQMFREGIGVVVEGTYDTRSQVFSSDRLMVNHSNEYRAPQNAEEMKKLYETVEQQNQPQASTSGEGEARQ